MNRRAQHKHARTASDVIYAAVGAAIQGIQGELNSKSGNKTCTIKNSDLNKITEARDQLINAILSAKTEDIKIADLYPYLKLVKDE